MTFIIKGEKHIEEIQGDIHFIFIDLYSNEDIICFAENDTIKDLCNEINPKSNQILYGFINIDKDGDIFLLNYILIDEDDEDAFRERVLKIEESNPDFDNLTDEIDNFIKEKQYIKEKEDDYLYRLLLLMMLLVYLDKENEEYEHWYDQLQEKIGEYLDRQKRVKLTDEGFCR